MKNFLFLLFLLNFVPFSHGQITNTNIIAELNVETSSNVSALSAKVKNTTELYHSLRYVFSVIIYDANNNTSKESKENLFSLDPYQGKTLYEATINNESNNKIIILFLVYDYEDKLVAKSRAVINENGSGNNNSEAAGKNDNTGFEILGIVVEDTKTKSGKDFYDKFYFFYNYLNLKGNQVVKINEMFSFRRTTRIIVSVGDETIHEFFAYPKEEYIEEMAKISVQRVYKYFENKKKEKSYISQN